MPFKGRGFGCEPLCLVQKRKLVSASDASSPARHGEEVFVLCAWVGADGGKEAIAIHPPLASLASTLMTLSVGAPSMRASTQLLLYHAPRSKNESQDSYLASSARATTAHLLAKTLDTPGRFPEGARRLTERPPTWFKVSRCMERFGARGAC